MASRGWPALSFAAILLVAPLLARPRPVAATAGDPELDLILARAADYVAGYAGNFPAAVAEEEYVQTAFRDPGSADRSLGSTRRRVLRSDFLLVRGPDDDQLIPFRDVFEVDGKPVRDRQERLQKLFLATPATAMADASRIAEESARYNIGPIDRTVNVPTLPLQFLQKRNMPRFQFRKGRQEVVNGLPAWRVDYVERARPTLIRRRGGDDVPAEGAFWIEAATGRVVRTRLRVVLPRDPAPAPSGTVFGLAQEETIGRAALDAEFVVTYRLNNLLGVWVPAEMKETYQYGERHIRATATYSNFRRFRLSTDESR